MISQMPHPDEGKPFARESSLSSYTPQDIARAIHDESAKRYQNALDLYRISSAMATFGAAAVVCWVLAAVWSEDDLPTDATYVAYGMLTWTYFTMSIIRWNAPQRIALFNAWFAFWSLVTLITVSVAIGKVTPLPPHGDDATRLMVVYQLMPGLLALPLLTAVFKSVIVIVQCIRRRGEQHEAVSMSEVAFL